MIKLDCPDLFERAITPQKLIGSLMAVKLFWAARRWVDVAKNKGLCNSESHQINKLGSNFFIVIATGDNRLDFRELIDKNLFWLLDLFDHFHRLVLVLGRRFRQIEVRL